MPSIQQHLAKPETINLNTGYGQSECGVWMGPRLLTRLVAEVTCRKCRGTKVYRTKIGAS